MSINNNSDKVNNSEDDTKVSQPIDDKDIVADTKIHNEQIKKDTVDNKDDNVQNHDGNSTVADEISKTNNDDDGDGNSTVADEISKTNNDDDGDGNSTVADEISKTNNDDDGDGNSTVADEISKTNNDDDGDGNSTVADEISKTNNDDDGDGNSTVADEISKTNNDDDGDGNSTVADEISKTNNDDDDHSDNIKDNNFNNSDTSYAKKSTVNALVIGLVIAVGIAAFMAGAYTMNMDQQEQLTQNDLDDAMAKLELKILQQQLADKQQAQQQQQQPSQPQVVRISADDDPIIGDPNAPITIIEFSDFQCPFCERFNSQTLPMLQEEYIDKGLVKLVFRDFPIQNIHPNAVVTALAAECADDQDAFKEMHDMLFENQKEWSQSSSQDIVILLVQYASDIGINTDEFETCIVTGAHIDDIRGDLEDGRAYGVSGTPGFYIGNDDIGYISVQGAQPFESFKRVIDTQLGT